MQAKSSQLDQFWTAVKADPSRNLPLLRKELENPANSAFFFYDGSKLLLALSTDRSDQTLALHAIAKADLHGIQSADYVRTVQALGSKGLDTREAAFRILAFPDFKAFIPQHSLTLGQDYSLICMLFPMDETLFVADLATRLATEPEVRTQKSLLLALWYAVTPAANSAVKAFADNQGKPAEATAYAKSLLDRTTRLGSPSPSSAQSLREERRKVMRRPISDEALIEFDQLTAKLIAKR
ncbi:hypothetical protein [Bradyrhizobium manausense]|uniref:hypothetical protein n=1 Tax=Bradyrhizobium manausense TaxID=989370 RepID=UPI001BADC2F9|nr:hypothetical protein [Bradyrhizobium manausense]MBR0725779.1 hypothetical protein [Bradyrhizobium manausense]